MNETDRRQKIARPWAACYERGKLKVMCLSIANIQLLKPVICGIFNMKKTKQNKTTDWERLPSFQSICDFSGIVYRTEPEKIFPANKPEFSL